MISILPKQPSLPKGKGGLLCESVFPGGGDGLAASKYNTVVLPNLNNIKRWIGDGATDKEVISRLRISESSFYKYKAEHAEFSELLKKTKEVVDGEVENALLKRALGYDYEDTTKELRINPATGKAELVVTKAVKKHVLPDVLAQMYWLKNRLPEKWRDAPVPPQDGEDAKKRADEAEDLRRELMQRRVMGFGDDPQQEKP